MSKSVKLTVIGAGSAEFSLGLVKDLSLTPSLAGSHISFMDINPERLDMIHKFAVRYASELGADLTFDRFTDRAASLQDADFVVNTAFVQGHYHARDARAVTARHGYYYGGVGLGSFYQLDVMLEVARDMEKICPDAWIIQSANPVFEGCTLMARETGIKVCGLCHGHYGYRAVASVIGLDPDHVIWEAPGLNHNIWLAKFLYQDEAGTLADAYPLLDEWIETKAGDLWRTHVAKGTHDIHISPAEVHQYKLYGLMPIGDTPRKGGWWYHTDLATKKRWYGEPYGGPDTELARPVFVERLEKRIAEMTRLANDPQASIAEVFGTEKTREQQVPIMDGLVNNNEYCAQVNVINNGALPGVPDDVVVEVPAIVNAKGIQPIRVAGLPPKIMWECIWPELLDMERDLLAFKTGDKSILLYNALQSHQTRSYEQAAAVLEDLLDMEGNERMKASFKFPKNW
ncbi:MAG: alpha-glucosidase/alpha-galactosidase [Anaerolineae bacterium]|nr:alpha-glucosidase/alpha-galactosidase [Anaerolineae bacterium]